MSAATWKVLPVIILTRADAPLRKLSWQNAICTVWSLNPKLGSGFYRHKQGENRMQRANKGAGHVMQHQENNQEHPMTHSFLYAKRPPELTTPHPNQFGQYWKKNKKTIWYQRVSLLNKECYLINLFQYYCLVYRNYEFVWFLGCKFLRRGGYSTVPRDYPKGKVLGPGILDIL